VDVVTLLTSVAPQMKQTLPDMPTYVIQVHPPTELFLCVYCVLVCVATLFGDIHFSNSQCGLTQASMFIHPLMYYIAAVLLGTSGAHVVST